MIETIRERLGDLVETWDAEAGMHTVACCLRVWMIH
jgi:hypothetical protein